MKHFLSVNEVTNLSQLVDNALAYKANPFKDAALGHNKRLGMLFLNPSMRTRISTQIAAKNLGMDAIVFNVGQDGWSLEFEDEAIMSGTTVEHIKDAAPVLGNYFDILGVRTFPSLKNKEDDYSELYVNQFIKYAGVPILSLESATLHPLQSLTDVITIQETFKEKRKPKIVLTWAPHVKALPQCVANSFSQWINAWGGADFVIGRMAGARALGMYAVAYEISNLPTTELVWPITRAVFPGYSRLAGDQKWRIIAIFPVRRPWSATSSPPPRAASLVWKSILTELMASSSRMRSMCGANADAWRGLSQNASVM